jgi:hypothetical protein
MSQARPYLRGMARTAVAIQGELDIWYEARTAIAQGQSYRKGDLEVSRAHIKHVNLTIERLERELSRAQRGTRGPMPSFGPA